jgi:hypothetical protein
MERSLAGTEAALEAACAAGAGLPAPKDAGPGQPLSVRDYLGIAGRGGFWFSDSEAATAGSAPSSGIEREAGRRMAGGLARSGDSDQTATKHVSGGAGPGTQCRGVQARQSPRLRVGCFGDSIALERWW